MHCVQRALAFWQVQHLTEFEGKRLINASREGLKLEEGDKEKRREDLYKDMFKPLIDYCKETLGKKARHPSRRRSPRCAPRCDAASPGVPG